MKEYAIKIEESLFKRSLYVVYSGIIWYSSYGTKWILVSTNSWPIVVTGLLLSVRTMPFLPACTISNCLWIFIIENFTKLCQHISTSVTGYSLGLLFNWKWRQYVPLKCLWTSARLPGVASEKTVLFLETTVRTSIPAVPQSYTSNLLICALLCHECIRKKKDQKSK